MLMGLLIPLRIIYISEVIYGYAIMIGLLGAREYLSGLYWGIISVL